MLEELKPGRAGVEEEAPLGEGLQGVVARDRGVPVEDEGSSFPECITLLPLGQPQVALWTDFQEVVWPVHCLKRYQGGV